MAFSAFIFFGVLMVDFRDRVSKLLKTATKVFGEVVVLMPKKGGQYKIKGIFDNEYQAIDPDTEEVVSSNQPVLDVNLHELKTDPKNGDRIKIRNIFYKVIDIREDGQGGASLFLHKERHGEKIRKKKDQAQDC